MVSLTLRNRGGVAILAGAAMLSSPVAAQPASTPPSAAVSEAREPRSVGLLAGVALGAGSEVVTFHARVGAVVHPRVAVFGELMGVATSGGGGPFLGGGARLSSDWLFVDARLGYISQSHSCDFEDPCTSDAAVTSAFGAGVELAHSKHAGLEARGDLVRASGDTVITFGLGGSFYLF